MLFRSSPYNMARAAAQRGAQVRYLNPLSSDRFGDQLADQLVKDGVQLQQERSECPTSLAVVQLANGQASYGFYREAVADRDYTVKQILAKLETLEPAILHTGSLMLVPPEHEKVSLILNAARGLGWTISLDVNLRPKLAKDLAGYRAAVEALMPLAHWLKASEEDLQVMGYEISALGQASTVAHAIRGLGVERVAVTLGAQGALLDVDGRQASREAPRVEVVDTVGAGDTFWGNCVAEWAISTEVAGNAVEQTLAHAMSAAAINCTLQGCQPPSWKQTQAFVSQA